MPSLRIFIAGTILSLVSHAHCSAQLPGQSPQQVSYVSPYQFNPSVTNPALNPDFLTYPKALPFYRDWSTTPYRQWTDFRIIQSLHTTWGPAYIPFLAPIGADTQSADWFQKRVVAAARLFRNTVPYAHHHVAQWRVPNEARWMKALPGNYVPGYGIDCSDFTHFAYSYAAGISIDTGVSQQSEITSAPMHLANGTVVQVRPQRLFDVQDGYVKNYDDLVSNLQPGDLLYIRSNPALTNPISHVIMWMGDLATDTQGIDDNLVMDSHGTVIADSKGQPIPTGPEIRPFREPSYYYGSFDHVLRYFPLDLAPGSSTTTTKRAAH